MSWADYGFHGLDATFALVNETFFACIKAVKERFEIVGSSNTILTRLASGYYRNRFPLWHDSIDNRGDGRRYFDIAPYIEDMAKDYVYSISYPKIYDMETLGTAGCNIVAATGRTCVYDSREFEEGLSDSDKTEYYKELLFKLLDQSWILKYKAILDLMRYPIIPIGTYSPACVIKMYDNSNGLYQSTLADAVTDVLAVETEINYSMSGYASNLQNLFYAAKNSDNTYRIRYLMKKAYIEATYVDDAIAATGDSNADYYVPYRINFRNDRTSEVYADYLFMAYIDRSSLTYIDYIGEDCYELKLEFDTQGLLDLIADKIDERGDDVINVIIAGADIQGVVSQIYDGANYFQFLDT